MQAVTSTLASNLPYALAGLTTLIALVALFLYANIRKARVSAGVPEAVDNASTTVVDFSRDPAAALVRASCERALALLRQRYGRGARYKLPWYMMIGGSGPDNAEVLSSLGLVLPFGEPDDPAWGGTPPLSWWIYERAVVLEAAGAADASTIDGADDPGVWFHLLRSLQEVRPARPLDGLVAVIPVLDLLEPPPVEGGTPSGLAQRAALLATRVAQAVQQLGFRLPVHVLVTGCEAVPGFTSFAATLPGDGQEAIFGWANPQPLSTAYSTAWPAEALASINRALYRSQLETFGQPVEPEDVATLFSFPQSLAALAGALTSYLNHLFQPGAGTDSCFFRSLSFAGSRTVPGELPAEREEPAQVLFVADLFAQKIFPESALAQPAINALARRNRIIRAAQALLVVTAVAACLGLWLGPRRVAERVAGLLPWFERVEARLPDTPGDAGTTVPASDRQLLADLNGIESYRVRTWGLPASWLSGLDRDVNRALAVASGSIFLPDMRVGLEDRHTGLVNGKAPPPHSKAPVATTLEGTGEFQDLSDFASALTALEGQVGTYDQFVTGSPQEEASPRTRLTGFRSLSSYALGVDLAPPASEASTSLARALGRVALPPDADFPLTPDPEVQQRGSELVTGLYAKAFGRNLILVEVRQLVDHINLLGQTGSSGQQDFDELEVLLAEIQATEKSLQRPDLAWVGAPQFTFSPAFQSVLATLGKSAWLGQGFDQTAQREGNAGFATLQRNLGAASTVYTGAVLVQKDGAVQLELSEGVKLLEQAIQDLLGQPFVPHGQAQPWQAAIPPGQRLVWDVAVLDQAAQLGAAYKTFLTQGVTLFPPGLRPQAQKAALDRMSVQVADLLAQAQGFVPAPPPLNATLLEQQIQSEVANYQSATPPLGQILAYSQQYGLTYGYRRLAQLVETQGLNTLRETRRLLDFDRLYAPRGAGFDWWDGQTPPSPAAFGVSNASGLTGYLTSQRNRASQLATGYAQTVIGGLEVVKGLDPWVSRRPPVVEWNAILAVLGRYSQQTPGNSLSDLESFISSDMTQIVVGNCVGKLADWQVPGADYFAAREAALRAPLGDRCDELVVEDGRAAYCDLAAQFDRELAGRYPFASHGPGELGAEAQPAAIARFFQNYDQVQGLIAEVPQDDFGSAGPAIEKFMGELKVVRAFFAPFLANPQAPPAFDFNVTFRANRGHEVNANQVFTWAVQSGTQEISTTDPFPPPPAGGAAAGVPAASSGASGPAATTLGHWVFGTPVQASFGWAQNSPWQPAAVQEPHAFVENGTVVYSFTNAWSLIRLLQAQAGSREDFDGLADPKPQTLKFTITTQPVQAVVNGKTLSLQPANATLFVRLELQSADDKKQALILPAVFPHRAAPLRCGAGQAVSSR